VDSARWQRENVSPMLPGVRVEYNRIKLLALVGGSALFTLGGLAIIFGSEGVLDTLLGCFLAVFFGAAGLSWFGLLRNPDPALVIDREGVGGTAFAPPMGKIPWSEVLEWQVGDVGFQEYVIVTVADVDSLACGLSAIDRAILRSHHPGLIFLLQLLGGFAQLAGRPDPLDVAGAIETISENVETGSISISPVGLDLSAEQIADLMEHWCT
jgi:hypothetical protein